jgi:hypothetical protein
MRHPNGWRKQKTSVNLRMFLRKKKNPPLSVECRVGLRVQGSADLVFTAPNCQTLAKEYKLRGDTVTANKR